MITGRNNLLNFWHRIVDPKFVFVEDNGGACEGPAVSLYVTEDIHLYDIL